MEKETRKRSIQKQRAEESRRVLCLLEDENPLTTVERDAVIGCISDEHISLLAKGQPQSIKGQCINGMFVGQGTCLAKKYGKYGMSEDQGCKSCRYDEILDQLNYIFREVFGGKYRAEWKQKRTYKRKEPSKVVHNDVKLEVEELSKKEECRKILTSMDSAEKDKVSGDKDAVIKGRGKKKREKTK
jgi:hypothetical protein